MAIDIVRTAVCRAPLDVAFEYVADYRNIPSWMLGIEQFAPVGDQERGEGAEFDVTARFGVRLHTRIRARSEEHTSELQSRQYLVCRLLLEKIKSRGKRLY